MYNLPHSFKRLWPWHWGMITQTMESTCRVWVSPPPPFPTTRGCLPPPPPHQRAATPCPDPPCYTNSLLIRWIQSWKLTDNYSTTHHTMSTLQYISQLGTITCQKLPTARDHNMLNTAVQHTTRDHDMCTLQYNQWLLTITCQTLQ